MLEAFLTSGLFFAQRNPGRQALLPTAGSAVPLLLGLGLVSLVVLAFLVALIQYRQRRQAGGAHHSPSELWAELCRVHQLDKTDVLALRELVEVRAMEPAAIVFVRADLWQLEQDNGAIQHLQPQLQRLQGLLFAGSQPEVLVVRL